MRAERIGQENRTNGRFGALKAGVLGAMAGAVVRNVAPVTQNEFDFFVKTQGKNSVENISKMAKAARPVSYFMAAGALIALTGHVIAESVKAVMPKSESKQHEVKEITMADAILDGLGTNTEIFILTNEAIGKKLDKNG